MGRLISVGFLCLRRLQLSHPDSDEDGYVELPDINVLEEMVDLMTTARSYEANLKVVDLTREMAMKALEIGR